MAQYNPYIGYKPMDVYRFNPSGTPLVHEDDNANNNPQHLAYRTPCSAVHVSMLETGNFSDWDEQTILWYLISHKHFYFLHCDVIWKNLAATGIIYRSWFSLKMHFINVLYKKLCFVPFPNFLLLDIKRLIVGYSVKACLLQRQCCSIMTRGKHVLFNTSLQHTRYNILLTYNSYNCVDVPLNCEFWNLQDSLTLDSFILREYPSFMFQND